ncbi:MAG: PTS sugar transporter subunit IIA [Planctomycetes bacterium]|nr:PTS sugar transporter subunit IIA [Planctomycetota bacterium]
MKLSELMIRESVVDKLKARDKSGALRELVQALKSSRKASGLKVDEVVEALLKREKIGSTGMGGGVALPHAKVEGVSTLMGAFGRSVEGLDFGAVDGEKVHLMFLIVSPPQDANQHLLALKRITMAVRSPNIAKFLKAARSGKEIHELFREIDETSAA